MSAGATMLARIIAAIGIAEAAEPASIVGVIRHESVRQLAMAGSLRREEMVRPVLMLRLGRIINDWSHQPFLAERR